MFTMSHLPVYQHRERILEALAANQVIVVESPTGSGKTTQIPNLMRPVQEVMSDLTHGCCFITNLLRNNSRH